MANKTPLFKSKLEAWIWKGLKAFTSKGDCKAQVEYESEALPYVIYKKYIPDFVITFKDGRKLYIEAKGYLRPSDRTKLVSVRTHNPTADIRIIFSVDNKLNKNSKTRYSEWATKHGFPYAINTIPKEWFK